MWTDKMMTINILDMIIIGSTVLSAIIGLFRGMAKEAITLITWVAAAIVAKHYGLVVGEYFTSISTELIRHLIGGFILFVGVIILGGIVNFVVGKVVKVSGFVVLDKIFGAAFGVLRSLLVVLIILIVFPFVTDLAAKEKWWQESSLVPKFQDFADYLRPKLPESWKQDHSKILENLKPDQTKILENLQQGQAEN